mmetsp:Transcript_137173/g.382620  ORF Transcript_137173/g.382620 Transcript_137173/m.382620 type:complete len:333 (-) Transcript_137173:81-1079(-)
MDFEPEGAQESLIQSAQEKTALRTRHFLVAGRLAFVFSHGALVITVSAALGWEADPSWWLVFLPVWLGDSACLVLVVASWFASCPYIQLCLSERQARLGDNNPSILTEILPDIVLAFLGLIFMAFALAAEIMLCRYLDRVQHGETNTIVPSTVVFIIVSLLATCRGICIKTNSAIFVFFGGGVLATSIAALCVAGGLFGNHGWVLVLPWCFSAAGLFVDAACRLRWCKLVLSRQERLLHIAEQFVLLEVLAALFVVILKMVSSGSCSEGQHLRAGQCSGVAIAGIAAGCGVCTVALLWGRMALVESRTSSVRERVIAWKAAASFVRQAVDPL